MAAIEQARRSSSSSLSLIIKTFERKECVVALLESIRRLGLEAPIHIADDSRTPYGAEIRRLFPDLDIDYLELPFDVGLSEGRNRLLDRVRTEHFMLLDDDYIFDERTDLAAAVRMLEEHDLDILGGATYDYKSVRYPWDRLIRRVQAALTSGIPFNYLGTFERDGDRLTIRYRTREIPDYLEAHIVPNFFVARTAPVRDRNRWDEELKFDEHTEFFLRAYGNGLRVASTRAFGARHCPVRPTYYMNYTDRGTDPLLYILRKHGIRDWRGIRDRGFTRLMRIEDGKLVKSTVYDRTLRGRYAWLRKEVRPRVARLLRGKGRR